MAKIEFKKATKKGAYLRMELTGPAGSGKTYTALKLAKYLAEGTGKPVRAIDSENRSMSKYADLFDFEVCELERFSPDDYIDAILAAADGASVVVVDSLSHAWMGPGGALEMADQAAKRSQSKNSYFSWRDVTPKQNELIQAIIRCPAHLIATMRSKTEVVIEEVNGKSVPRKIGTKAIQREGMEFEFDVCADMTIENDMIIGKTRCSPLAGKVFTRPGADVAKIVMDWLGDAPPVIEPTQTEKEQSAHEQILADPEVKDLFEKLKAPPSKRLATVEKYGTREAVLTALRQKLPAAAGTPAAS